MAKRKTQKKNSPVRIAMMGCGLVVLLIGIIIGSLLLLTYVTKLGETPEKYEETTRYNLPETVENWKLYKNTALERNQVYVYFETTKEQSEGFLLQFTEDSSLKYNIVTDLYLLETELDAISWWKPEELEKVRYVVNLKEGSAKVGIVPGTDNTAIYLHHDWKRYVE